MSAPSGSAPTLEASPAPWHLPKVWPPAVSATVSSSFMRHPGEGLADVAGRRQRIGIAARALGIDVDQAHLDRGERLLERHLLLGWIRVWFFSWPTHSSSVPQ